MNIIKYSLMLLLLLLSISTASAGVSGYDYRMPIEINNTGNVLTDFQYNFTMDTAAEILAGNMTSDNGSDCCIADSSDVLQDFWNETAFNLSDTKIWVRGSSLYNVSNTTHYIYYGKSGASSLIDGDTTFEFFDTFDGTSLNTVPTSEDVVVTDNSSNYESWPGIAKDSSGNLFVVYRTSNTNTHMYDATGKVVIRKSTDSGNTWGNEITVSDVANNDDRNANILIFDNNSVETILVVYNSYDGNGANDRVYVKKSTDGGNTWGSAIAITPASERRSYGTPRLLSNGKLLIPIDNSMSPWSIFVVESTDGGDNWTEYDVGTDATHQINEISIIETKTGGSYTGGIYAIMRSEVSPYSYYQATSTDYGHNWSSVTVVSAITNTYNTPLSLHRAPNGEILGVRSDASSNIIVHESTDECGNWSKDHIEISGVGTNLYPSMETINNSKLIVVWATNVATSDVYANFFNYPFNSRWAILAGSPVVSDGILNMTGTCRIYSNQDFNQDIVFESRTYIKNIRSLGLMESPFDFGGDNILIENSSMGYDFMVERNNDGWYQNGVYTVSAWKNHKLTWSSSDVYGYENEVEKGHKIASDGSGIPIDDMPIYLYTYEPDDELLKSDWVFIRKHVDAQPVATLGAEESVPSNVPVITLLSQTPSTIYKNSTGYLNISYGIYHNSSGLNNTSVSFIYREYDYDLSDSNHSIRPPSNNLASVWNFNGRILRAANRNETIGLNFENNATITGGDTYTWSGLDENSTKLTIVPVNSTYTLVYINATVHCIMPQMWYLDRTDQQKATKTQLAIHKTSNVLIKFWNFEIYKGNYDFLGVGYTDTLLSSNPALWPSDANPVNFYYVNSSYDPATGGDPITSGYAVYMGSLNASGWTDHVYSRSNSNYVQGFIDNNYLHTIINTTNISYLYFTSNTPSSHPFYINMTNVASSTNVSFANTNTLWAGNTPPFTLQSYTPNIWFAFMKLNMSFDHKLYAADNNDLWGVSSMNRTNITQALFPPTTPVIDHFHFLGETDYDMDGVYYGNFSIGCGVSSDPDGGDVTHNLTLHYANNLTFVTIINNTFTDKDITHNGVYFDANFSSSPYYSDDVNYTLRLIATDDESESITVWLDVNFTLSITPIITSYTPSTPVTTIQHDTQEFTINISQIVNVTWYIDGSVVSTVNNTNYSTYSNSTAPIGTYNVTAHVENVNGTRQHMWEWNVEDPVFAALLQLQADIDKMKKTQTIIQALIFLVIGVIVGVVAQRRRFNDEDSEKPIESKNN